MYKSEHWGKVSFDLVCPIEETVHMSDTDSADKNLAMLNYVDTALSLEKQRNTVEFAKAEKDFTIFGVSAGLTLGMVSKMGLDYGLCSIPALGLTVVAGLLAICAYSNKRYCKLIKQANTEIDEEMARATNLRQVIQQSK